MEPNETLIDTEAVARHFNVSARSVINWATREGCPHLKTGGLYRFYLSEVLAWARQRGASPSATTQAAV